MFANAAMLESAFGQSRPHQSSHRPEVARPRGDVSGCWPRSEAAQRAPAVVILGKKAAAVVADLSDRGLPRTDWAAAGLLQPEAVGGAGSAAWARGVAGTIGLATRGAGVVRGRHALRATGR